MAFPTLRRERTRQRGDSDPTISNASPAQPSNAPALRRRTSLSSRPYDKDYKQYVHDSFVVGDRPKEPWLLDPPRQIETPEEAHQAYYFAHYRLKHRDITPRTEAFLIEYRKTLKEYLEKPGDGSKMIEVKTLTSILHSKTILYEDPAPEYQSAMTAVRELAKLRYYADYGDYHASCATRSVKIVKNADILIGKSWTQVQKAMVAEDEAIEKHRSVHGPGVTKGFPESPITTLVYTACSFLNVEFDNVKYSIGWYAERNKHSHSNVTTSIRNCDWDSLGRQLWQDMKEIPNVLGAEDARKMMESLKRLRDQFFLELTATSRIPNDEAADLLEKKQARNRAKEAARREQKKKLMEAEKKRVAAVQRKKERQSKSSDIIQD
ncbi:MAG: hypothetical protein Q9171_007210 [Xanthocarpia ochracea]